MKRQHWFSAFSCSKNNRLIYTNELSEAVAKDNLTTAVGGKRYRTKLYNLSMILAIGYRVESQRGVQFRRWATTHLREYLVKGFVMDDVRLKEPKPWDYLDEWLERIPQKDWKEYMR